MSWDWLLDKFEAVWVLRQELDSCKQALAQYAQEDLLHERKVQVLEHQVEIERTRRISAEVVAAERRVELDRLHELLGEARRDLQTVLADRLKSLDSLNLKLMSPPVRETQDIQAFRAKATEEAFERASKMTMQKFKAADRAIDQAVLVALQGRNRSRVTNQKGVLDGQPGDPPGTGTLSEGGPLSNGVDPTATGSAGQDPGAA